MVFGSVVKMGKLLFFNNFFNSFGLFAVYIVVIFLFRVINILYLLSYSFHIQPSSTQSSGFFDVYSVNSHESICNDLSAIG